MWFQIFFVPLQQEKIKTMEITNGSKRRCRAKFHIKGIGKQINNAVSLLKEMPVDTVIAEFLYDFDDAFLYNVLLFLIRENCKEEKIICEISKFDYIK